MSTLFAVASLTALLVGSPSSATTSFPTAAMLSPPSAASAASQTAPSPVGDIAADTRQANKLLADLKSKYRYLDGATVTIGTTPNGEQAIAYYTEGQIVISRTHTVSIDKIVAHEIWHIIDWRDNGRLDWHESVPPFNSSPYLRGSL
jgi:hypothetical protein